MMMASITTKNLGFAYEVTDSNGRVFRVRREFDGPQAGNWTVKSQDPKLARHGVEHWFTVGVEARKKDAMRLIEDGHYAAS